MPSAAAPCKKPTLGAGRCHCVNIFFRGAAIMARHGISPSPLSRLHPAMSEFSNPFASPAATKEELAWKINQYFWETARRKAEARLPADVRPQVGASDIANMALKSAISSLAAGRKVFDTENEFERYLALTIRDKAVEATRTARRDKRDSRRNVHDENAIDDASIDVDPILAEAIIGEMADIVRRHLDSETDEIKRAINYFYFYGGLRDHVLLEALTLQFGANRAPSARTMYRHLAAVKAELRELLDTGDLTDATGDSGPPAT